MSIDIIFRGGPDIYFNRGLLIVPKWFGLPNGTYCLVGCDDGGYKYISVFPIQNNPDNNSLEADIELA